MLSALKTQFPRCCQGDVTGFKNLFEILKIPLYLASLSIASGIMVARFHRSKQFKRNMEITEAKNNFDRRFKHEEEFGRFISKVENLAFLLKSIPPSTVNHRSGFEVYVQMCIEPTAATYSCYFPNSNSSFIDDNLNVSTIFIESIFRGFCYQLDLACSKTAYSSREIPVSLTNLKLPELLTEEAINSLQIDITFVQKTAAINGYGVKYLPIDVDRISLDFELDHLYEILIEIANFMSQLSEFLRSTKNVSRYHYV